MSVVFVVFSRAGMRFGRGRYARRLKSANIQ